MNENVYNLKRLKDLILNNTNLVASYEDIRIYNEEGIELDSSDVSNLIDKQILFVSTLNQKFDTINYYNRFKIVSTLKSFPKFSETFSAISKTKKFEDLTHINIIKHIIHFFYQKHFFVITEFIESENLETYIVNKGGRLMENEAKNIIKQLIEAIKYSHDKNISNLNLNVQNLFIHDERIIVFNHLFKISNKGNKFSSF